MILLVRPFGPFKEVILAKGDYTLKGVISFPFSYQGRFQNALHHINCSACRDLYAPPPSPEVNGHSLTPISIKLFPLPLHNFPFPLVPPHQWAARHLALVHTALYPTTPATTLLVSVWAYISIYPQCPPRPRL